MRIGTTHEETIHCPYCGQDVKVAVMPPDFFGDEEEVWFLEAHLCPYNAGKHKTFYPGDKVI